MPGKSHGRRSLVGYSPRGCNESDTTEQLHFHWVIPYSRVFVFLFVCLFCCAGLSWDMQGRLVAACGRDLAPWSGIEPRPPTLGAWSLRHRTTRDIPLRGVLNWTYSISKLQNSERQSGQPQNYKSRRYLLPKKGDTNQNLILILWKRKLLSHVQLFATPWTVACQAPLSMGFSTQEYRSGLPFPSSGGSFQPRDGTEVSCTAGRFYTVWELEAAYAWFSLTTYSLIYYKLLKFGVNICLDPTKGLVFISLDLQ